MKYLSLLLAVLGTLAGFAGDKKAMSFEDFFTMKRISHISVSPDGSSVLCRIRQADVDANKYVSAVYLVDVATGDMTRMTPEGVNAGSPQWRPDGKAFVYTTGGQIYLKEMNGSAARQVTNAPEGAGGPRFSPDGKWLLYASTVQRDPSERDHSGKLMDGLLFRQWNEWRDNIRNHVFLISADAHKGQGKDITPGDFDAPPLDLGSSHDYTFSPDGKEVTFVKNTDKIVAASTNNDLFRVDLATMKETRITTSKANDAEPYYSPDGKYIAYSGMDRPGFEADRHILRLYDRKSGKILTPTTKADHDAGSFTWSPDSKYIYYLASVEGAKSIYRMDLKGKVKRLTDGFTDKNLGIDAAGKNLFFTRETTHTPAELYTLSLADTSVRKVTSLNDERLAGLDMNPWESFWFDSPNGKAKVQGFMIKPPNFDASKKYPMIYLIHGGPQGMWGNLYHYRWNAQMFAAPGYVVVLVNPHGSKGYGQKFCDAVTKDWGGLPYQDLMKGLDVALDKYDFIDKDRIGAAGASYGGYMINWIAGHDNPFKALVSHNGVFNLPSMAYCTEELWFTEWEFGGTYHENPELYEKWSPHKLAGNFKKPMLVIHSELDFRVPLNQGIELYTAHQRQGVPSKWLYFPDEDHFVNTPHNARMWWRTVMGWMDKYVKGE